MYDAGGPGAGIRGPIRGRRPYLCCGGLPVRGDRASAGRAVYRRTQPENPKAILRKLGEPSRLGFADARPI